MSDKRAIPFKEAVAVAQQLYTALLPFCERCKVVGSLRRRKATVGDIEILYISRTQDVAVDLFGNTKIVSLAGGAIEAMLDDDIGRGATLRKRQNVKGSEIWGPLNKLAVHVSSGIPVDLFATTPENWWNSLVTRTGGKMSNILLCKSAIKKGWNFEAYGSGFVKQITGERHQSTSEQDVFEFVGLPYREPQYRP